MRDFLKLHYVAYNHFEVPWALEKRVILDYELLIITQGSGILTLEDQEYPFSAGHILVIPAGRTHSFCSCKLPLELYCIHFDSYSWEGSTGISTRYQNSDGTIIRGYGFDDNGSASLNKTTIDVPVVTVPEKGALPGILAAQLCKAIFKWKKEDLSRISELTLELIAALSPMKEAEKSPVERIIGYVEKHYNRTITLKELSEFLHLQPTYISHLFKKDVGISLTAYIRRYRITVAKSLLRYSGVKLEEIAVQTGFYDSSHFNRAFLLSEGITPAKYRKGTK